MASLAQAFRAAAAARRHEIALIDGSGQRITFDALAERAAIFAGVLRSRAIGKGDRVLVAMPVGIDLYVTLAGLWKVGAVAIFPEPALGLFGLRHALKVTRPKGFVRTGLYRFLPLLVPGLVRCKWLSPDGRGDALDDSESTEATDPAMISFTSGTSGAPKAIERSHGFLMAQYDAVAPLLTSERAERDLVAFPVFVLVNLAAGRTSVLPDWKLSRQGDVTGAALAGWMERNEVTRALLPPALCAALGDAEMPPMLNAIFTGGGPVFPDVMQRLMSLRPDLNLVAVYGSTEAEPIAEIAFSDIHAEDWTRMADGGGLLAGRPLLDLRILDDEIQVAGPHVNDGYLDPAQNRDTKIVDAGMTWHRTGDAGYLDDQGRVWLLGRLAGRVEGHYPFAVETGARIWPGVSDAALVDLKGRAVLALAGDAGQLEAWQKRAESLGMSDVRHVRGIPKDRRHRSKTDLVALRDLLERAG